MTVVHLFTAAVMTGLTLVSSLHAFFNPLYFVGAPPPPPLTKIHPIKMHYELPHRVLHPCCAMTCGGAVVMCSPHAPNPKTINTLPPSSKKYIYMSHPLTKTNKLLLPHSPFYIFAHVESGWFVIYLSKLIAASSLVMFPFPRPETKTSPVPLSQCMCFLNADLSNLCRKMYLASNQ